MSRVRDHGPECLWFLLLAVVVTWPMPTSPMDVVVGHEQATAGCHVWVLWWAQQHLGTPHTDLLFFPNGVDVITLYGSDFLSPLVFAALPIPAVLAFNLWVLLLLVLGGLGGRALGRTLGAGRWGALAGGTVFLSAPFFQHELLNGTTELLAAAVLPWFVSVLWRLLESPTRGLGIALGVLTGLGTLASAYNGFFLLTVGMCVFVHRISTTPGRVVSREHWRHGLLGVGVSGLFLGPLAWLQLGHGAAATLARRDDWRTREPPLPDSFADLSDWLDPSPADLPALLRMPGGESFEYWTTCSMYLGFVAVFLACLGILRARQERIPGGRGRVVVPLVLFVVVGVLFASGPILRHGGDAVQVAGGPLALPLGLVAELLPPANLTGLHAYRYTSVVLTGLCALVALGARGRFWFLVIALESIAVGPTPWPAPVTSHPHSPVLTSLAMDPSPGAVLTLPTRKENLHDLGRLLLAQTRHGRPVQDGGIHRRAGAEATELFDEVLLLERQAELVPRYLTAAQTRYDLGLLHAAGYRWLLIPTDEVDATEWAGRAFGPPDAVDDHWALWPLPTPAKPEGTLSP